MRRHARRPEHFRVVIVNSPRERIEGNASSDHRRTDDQGTTKQV
jgi:hypothetical protein